MAGGSFRVREAASIALAITSVVLSVALDDLGPAVIAMMAALLIAPWRKWKQAKRGRRCTRADLAATAVFVSALMLTLLMPDGPLRWLVIGTLAVAWVFSWRLLDPER